MSRHIAAQRRAELDALLAENGGTVTPALVVAFAANPDTALHSLFTWDDSEAAKKYREVEAAAYLRAVVRLVPNSEGQNVSVRAFVSLSSERGGGMFRPIVDVMENDERRAQLVRDALRDLNAIKSKYGHLRELAKVWDAVAEQPLLASAA